MTVTLPVPAGRWRKRLDAAEEQWLGNGSTVPATLHSPGEVRLTLGPKTCILYVRMKEA